MSDEFIEKAGELLEDAMMQISDDFTDASGILAKFDA